MRRNGDATQFRTSEYDYLSPVYVFNYQLALEGIRLSNAE